MSDLSPEQRADVDTLERFILGEGVMVPTSVAAFASLDRLKQSIEQGLSDERILAGCRAVRRMHMLRVGGAVQHAQAFRDAAAAVTDA
jgi:hypothetical protein